MPQEQVTLEILRWFAHEYDPEDEESKRYWAGISELMSQAWMEVAADLRNKGEVSPVVLIRAARMCLQAKALHDRWKQTHGGNEDVQTFDLIDQLADAIIGARNALAGAAEEVQPRIPGGEG